MKVSANDGTIVLGPEERVTSSETSFTPHDVVIAADPHKANRIVICAIVVPAIALPRYDDVAWLLSTDGTWRQVLYDNRGKTASSDVSCAIGSSGHLYVGETRFSSPMLAPNVLVDNMQDSYDAVLSSADSGTTWNEAKIYPVLDRDFVGVSTVPLTGADRVYFYGTGYGTSGLAFRSNSLDARSVTLLVSHDGARTFALAQRVITNTNGYQAESKPAIMPNGDLIVLYGTRKISTNESSDVDSSTSTYTPLRFSSNGNIAYHTGAPLTQKGSCNGSEWLPDAVDSSNGPFHGRLYVVYGDNSYGACHVLISWSNNEGVSWSTPVIVDDTRPALGYANLEPSIAVNSKGVIGVAWLGRDATRYVPRFAYSMDGGLTFSPSVPISTQPGSLDPLFGPFRTVGSSTMPEHGATYARPPFTVDGPAGSIIMDTWTGLDMTAATDGSFFVAHIDNRYHRNDIWLRQIAVRASASRFGSAMLNGLHDVSQDFFVSCLTPHLSTDATRFHCQLALVNLSTNAQPAPRYFRFIYLRSYLGDVTIADSVNGITGPGALFRTPPSWHNTILRPGETRMVGDFSFDIQKWPSSYIGREKADIYGSFASGLLDFDVQVLR